MCIRDSPINENLAQKYISKREPGIERIIKVLTPSTIQSNSTPIRGNISFSLDSSVIYSCYKENNSDTIVEHHLIYSKQSISNFHAKESKVILKETIEKNWTYLVVKNLYIW